MDDGSRTPATSDAVQRARAVSAVVASAADDIFRQGRLPEQVLAAMYDADLFRLAASETVGGGQCDPQTFAEVAEVLGAADMSTAWCFVQAGASAHSLSTRLPADTAREVFGARTSVIAAGSGISPARADAVDGGYVVTGNWAFASGCMHATWFSARAVIWRDGEPTGGSGLRAVSDFLVPRDQVSIVASWDVAGMRGTGSHGYQVRDLFVPEHRVQPLIATYQPSAPPQLRIPTLTVAHIAFASIGLGAAWSALDEFRDLAAGKVAALARERLGESTSAQGALGRGRARIRAALAHRDWAIAQLWAEAQQGEVSDAARAEVRLAATAGIETALEVIDSLYRLAGTTGIFASSTLHRRFQDIHVLSQQIVGRPSHYENVGRFLLGMTYDQPLI